MPSLFSYCNYIFNLQSSVIGPSFEFKDWDDFINLRGDYVKMRPFSNYPRAFIRYGQGLLCLVVSTICGIYFPPNRLIEASFGSENYIYRVFHLYMSM